MRQKLFALFSAVAVTFSTGCDDSGDPGVSRDEVIKLSLERLKKNENISYEMFDVLSKRMTADSLSELKAGSATKANFIDVVARQTKDYFEEVVEKKLSDFAVTEVPMPFSGEAEITLKAVAKTESVGAAPEDPVAKYADLVLKRIQEQSQAGKKEWVVIESLGTIGNVREMPTETISLNFAKITYLTTVPHSIIMNMSLSDEQMLNELNKVLNANDIPPVAIALLLPAVQKMQEAAGSKNSPFPSAMEAWLDGPVAETVSDHGLDRDIIRRIHAKVYLAGLHTLLLDEYNGANEDMASLSILHARYRAAVISASEVLWSK